jgi:tRNA dimethylallyltransferase
MPADNQRAILIAGPTASGNAAFALETASRVGGAVINADSMQVYRDLMILTARPTPEDEERAPHRLYGHVAGSEAYSAARFADEARRAIAEARAEGLVPVIVGGTGLYFKALLEGLSPVPPVPDDIRAHWRSEAERAGAAALHAVLARRDPVMAERLKATDPQRIVRALEVLEATGRSLADWHETPGKPVLEEGDTERFVLMPEREELYRRCEARFEAMMAAGAVEEAEALGSQGLDSGLPVMRALGVAPLLDLIAGKVTREEAIERAKAETRQYAKRQVTWLRSNMSTWNSISTQ